MAITIIPKANEIPTKPKLPPDSWFIIIAPVPQNTKAKVPINSAKYIFKSSLLFICLITFLYEKRTTKNDYPLNIKILCIKVLLLQLLLLRGHFQQRFHLPQWLQ